MRPNHCPTVLHVFIFAAVFHNLEADSEDSSCETEIRIHRNTHYEVLHGEELTIKCPVRFCNNPPPNVSWFKLDNTVPVSANSSSHIKTEWTASSHSEGTAFLVFQNILRSDSGVYQCRSGGSIGHSINVSVYDFGLSEHTTVTQKTDTSDVELTSNSFTTSKLESSTSLDTLWLFLYRVAGIMVFAIIMLTICVVSKSGCKGVCCSGESRDTADLRSQPDTHIYVNDYV